MPVRVGSQNVGNLFRHHPSAMHTAPPTLPLSRPFSRPSPVAATCAWQRGEHLGNGRARPGPRTSAAGVPAHCQPPATHRLRPRPSRATGRRAAFRLNAGHRPHALTQMSGRRHRVVTNITLLRAMIHALRQISPRRPGAVKLSRSARPMENPVGRTARRHAGSPPGRAAAAFAMARANKEGPHRAIGPVTIRQATCVPDARQTGQENRECPTHW